MDCHDWANVFSYRKKTLSFTAPCWSRDSKRASVECLHVAWREEFTIEKRLGMCLDVLKKHTVSLRFSSRWTNAAGNFQTPLAKSQTSAFQALLYFLPCLTKTCVIPRWGSRLNEHTAGAADPDTVRILFRYVLQMYFGGGGGWGEWINKQISKS